MKHLYVADVLHMRYCYYLSNVRDDMSILNDISNCNMCGKAIDFMKFNKDEYRYKIHYRSKLRYYCCYTCWMKARVELGIEEKDNKYHSRWHN